MLIFDGPLKLLITFNKHLKHSGIELTVYQAGWLFALQFVEYGDPPQAKLVCIPRPDLDSVSAGCIQSPLQMCMVSMDLPRPVERADSSCHIRLKLCCGAIIFDDFLPWDMMSADLYRPSHILNLMAPPPPMRLIAKGKMVIQEYPIRYYIHSALGAVTAFHFVLSLRGGGGPRPTPMWEAKHLIAATMVAAGASLKETDRFADQLVEAAGPGSILESCKPASLTAKINNMKKLAHKLQIMIPDLAHQATKVQNKVRDKLRNSEVPIDAQELPRHLSIQERYFLNQDDTTCQQLQLVQPNQSGCVLMTPQDAMAWLQTPQVLSPDEFAIITLGSCLCEDKTSCNARSWPFLCSARQTIP